jgi:small subunit ribosomal protein S8
MTDTIADMIIRIKNAYMARNGQVRIPYSKMNKAIADILVSHHYVEGLHVEEKAPQNDLLLDLRYVGKIPAITEVRRLSKPGRRLYAGIKQVPRALGGYGITIVSTSRGVMTDKQARDQKVGGELLCQIW